MLLLSSPVFADGVSSIGDSASVTSESSQVRSSNTYIIKTVIRDYVRKNWMKKLEKVYNKLDDATISLTPKQYRPILIQIKEIIEDDYSLWQSTKLTEAKQYEKLSPKKVIEKKVEEAPEIKEVEVLEESKKPDVLTTEPAVGWLILYSEIYALNEWTIDVSILQNTRLWRVNALRKERGRNSISLSSPLHDTATERSEVLKKKWVADHRRTSSSSYYNYAELVDWFEQRGITFTNVNRATFTENIGYARLTCRVWDCTDSAINSMRTIFDFFVSEEWTANDAHWRTIMHPKFKIMGMWIAVDESTKRLYVTQHYGTEIK